MPIVGKPLVPDRPVNRERVEFAKTMLKHALECLWHNPEDKVTHTAGIASIEQAIEGLNDALAVDIVTQRNADTKNPILGRAPVRAKCRCGNTFDDMVIIRASNK